MRRALACASFLALAPVLLAARPETTAQLGRDFFAWRHQTQPITPDDVNRVERTLDWTPDCSPAALQKARDKLQDFERRFAAIPRPTVVADEVDLLLLRSALARTRFELDVVRAPWRNPDFYVQQTLGALFDALLRPPPFTRERVKQLLGRLKVVPTILRHAETNLDESVDAFAVSALAGLKDVRARLTAVADNLKPELPAAFHTDLDGACRAAATALEGFARWLETNRPQMKKHFAIGREAYRDMLRRVALIPYPPEELLRIAESEWSRNVAFDAYEANRTRSTSPAPLAASAQAQIERLRKDEAAVRDFLRDHGILDVPDWLGHYRNRPLPPYLAPLVGLGVTNDLTLPSRRGEGAVSYIPPPSPSLSYFAAASARDPRPILVHEGVPGHFLQLALSWANTNPIRREYFDSGPIEGIGSYAEEMMLQHGYFDDRPGTRAILYRFARLRALRVIADVRLHTGEFTIEQAAVFLEQWAPMDRETALEEARFFAAAPGQAISYQIGKSQIIRFLAEARRVQGDKFQLREFHNRLWREGNVPISLQRWESLGLDDEVATLRKD